MRAYFFYFFLIFSSSCFSEKILIKIPTRERPDKFFSTLNSYINLSSNEHEIIFLISCDEDDIQMNNSDVKSKLEKLPNLYYYFSPRQTKIEAINRDLNNHSEFDLLIAASDDMVPKVKNYDKIIVEKMRESFPEFDGVLNFNDGFIGHQLNTIPIIGKNYYKKFNYIYHPDYKSVCCDLELTLVSRLLGKEACFNEVLFLHQHPTYGYAVDSLYIYNESSQFHAKDKTLLHKRFAKNFDLQLEEIKNNKILSSFDLYGSVNQDIKWSILICTLDERSDQFYLLLKKIMSQIEYNNLTQEVEVLFYKDNREVSVGRKRNALLKAAKGKYLCFIDDDDDISDFYVSSIYKKLEEIPDCVSLKGIIIHDGKKEKFVHSIKIKEYGKIGTYYLRYPNHLNVIKSSIAKQFDFPEKNYGEDFDWATKIYKSGLLIKESSLNRYVYIYRYDSKKSATVNR